MAQQPPLLFSLGELNSLYLVSVSGKRGNRFIRMVGGESIKISIQSNCQNGLHDSVDYICSPTRRKLELLIVVSDAF